MLTTMFYYGYYKSYMIKTADNGVQTAPKRDKIASKATLEKTKDATFLLNKSLKTDVIKYAKDISQNVVGTKDASKNLIKDMEDLNQNTYKEDFDTAKQWVSDDLEAFVNSYNSATEFLFMQSHSLALQKFGSNMASNIEYNSENLQNLGVEIDASGKLSFQTDTFSQLDQGALNVAIGENINLFQTMYDEAKNVLHAPLSDHMKFKSLGYYYNYKFGSMQSDTFKIIESGMLIDKIV